MAEIQDLLGEAKRHRLIITNKTGKQLIELPLIWAVIIALVAHQLAVLVALGALLDILTVGLEEIENSETSKNKSV